MRFFERDLSFSARLYIGTVIVSGSAILVYSVYNALAGPDFRWLYLVCLTVIGSVFPVRIPSQRGQVQSLTVTISDIFIFTAILLFSPEVAVTIAVIESGIGATISLSARHIYKILFNLNQISIVTFSVGWFFYHLAGTNPPLTAVTVDIPQLFLNLGFCALLYFMLNSSAVATAMALTTGRSVITIWKTDFLWVSLPTFAGASAAAIIFVYFEETPFLAIAVAAPIVLIIHYAYKLNLERIRQSQQHVDQLDVLYHSTISSLAMAIDAKDAKTHGHIERVQGLTLKLAEIAGMTDETELEGLRAAALMHDIGKIAIPEYILNKPSSLNSWEMQVMRKHPTIGADILSSIPFPYPVIPFVRYHHEKWDGTGYPDGLKGEQIPLGARILAIADCYDALRSDRPYRPKLDREIAIEHIKSESGKAYDPAIVEKFLHHVDELEREMKEPESRSSETFPPREDRLSDLDTRMKSRIDKTVFYEIASTHTEIQALHEISDALSKSLKVSETLSLLSDKIGNFVPYTSCAVYLMNSENDRLMVHHGSGKHSDLLERHELRMAEGITGWVAVHKEHLMNVSPAPDFVQSERLHFAYRSCLVTPLSLDENIVGVISLYSEEPDNYNADHLRFMEGLSDHAATAIRNAIIYEETQEEAYTDLLTGLPNLRYFTDFMKSELERSSRLEEPFTLLMMDLESFKQVNDRFGHKIGDQILMEIAHILRDQLRESDTCIRYAGDEFIAILPGVKKEQAKHAIERLQKTLDEQRLRVDEKNLVQVGISIGAASFSKDGRDADLLLAVADRAMYRDKFARSEVKNQSGNIISFEKGLKKPS